MKRKIICLLVMAVLAVVAVGCGLEEEPTDQTQEEEVEPLLSGKHYVNINIKDKGTIKVELDADAAPITATNFVRLVKEGFYDGLTFHRIIEGFMMQGGDPAGTGMGEADRTITGEFESNGVDNPISHIRGTISMARSAMPDSASCQFFIMHQDGTYLDGDYAAFGHVTEGMEIVDDICENTSGQDSNGMVPKENRPVIESIEYVEEASHFSGVPGTRRLAYRINLFCSFLYLDWHYSRQQ